jgi:hypothetical protein
MQAIAGLRVTACRAIPYKMPLGLLLVGTFSREK